MVSHPVFGRSQQRLCAHGARQRLVRNPNLVPPCAAKCHDPYLDRRCGRVTHLVYGQPDYGIFFSIPGLGSYTIDAITSQDFAIVRAMVFLGSVLYVIGLLLTDISYTLVDPRVRLS